MEFTQTHLAMGAPEDSLDSLKEFGSPGGVVTRQNFGSPFTSIGQLPPSPSYSATSTCLRGFKDGEGYDMICFCIRCQDLFIAQDIHSGSEQNQTSPSDMSIVNSVTISDSSVRSPSSPRPSKKSKAGKNAGVSKPANPKNLRPEVLIDQLEVALHGDENSSSEFKWKTSVLFNELKRLIENESANQKLNTKSPSTAQPAVHSRRPKKKGASKGTSYEKIFKCSKLHCNFSTSSSMDWRRHEETHWPQKRYMCVQCPLSDSNSDLTKCSYCLSQLHNTNDPHSHYLQCESARRNARSFARKDKLSDHLQKDHSFTHSSAMSQAATWIYPIDSRWPRQCDFCFILFDNWDERAVHLIDNHFRRSSDHRVVVASKSISGHYFTPREQLDTKNFDTEFTSERPTMQQPEHEYPSKELQHRFEGFTYSHSPLIHTTLDSHSEVNLPPGIDTSPPVVSRPSTEKSSDVKGSLSLSLPPDTDGQFQFSYEPPEEPAASKIPDPPGGLELSLPSTGYSFKRFDEYDRHATKETPYEPTKPAIPDPPRTFEAPEMLLPFIGYTFKRFDDYARRSDPEDEEQSQPTKPVPQPKPQPAPVYQDPYDPIIGDCSPIVDWDTISLRKRLMQQECIDPHLSSEQKLGVEEVFEKSRKRLSAFFVRSQDPTMESQSFDIDANSLGNQVIEQECFGTELAAGRVAVPTTGMKGFRQRVVSERKTKHRPPVKEQSHQAARQEDQPSSSTQKHSNPTISLTHSQILLQEQELQDLPDREQFSHKSPRHSTRESYDSTIFDDSPLNWGEILRQEQEIQDMADREQFSAKLRPVSMPIDCLTVERADAIYRPKSYKRPASTGNGRTFERSLSKMAPVEVSSRTWIQTLTQQSRGSGQERKSSVPQTPQDAVLSSAMAKMSINEKTSTKGFEVSLEGKTRWYDRLRGEGEKQPVESIPTTVSASPPVLDALKLPPVSFDVDEITFLPPIET